MRVRHRVVLSVATSATIATALAGLFLHLHLSSRIEAAARESLRSEASVVAAWVEAADGTSDPQELAFEASRRLAARVTLLDADGRVLADSSMDRSGMPSVESGAERPEVRQALDSGRGEAEGRSAVTGLDYLYAATRVEGAGPVRVVRIGMPISGIHDARNQLLRRLLLTLGLAVAFMSALALQLGRRLSRPLGDVAKAAERVARGDASELEEPAGDREVTRLGAAVVRMHEASLRRLEALEAERQILLSVLRGMKEGLALVDAEHRIRLANESFRIIFAVQGDPTGRRFSDVARHPAILQGLDLALGEGREAFSALIEEPIAGRTFEVRMTPVPPRSLGGPPEVIVLFLDVTRLEALERVRREFVADVSHELRTPLTSIKGAVETLLEAGPDDRESGPRFLEMVRRHADRMEALLEDLTDLSLIETGAARLDPVVLDAAEVASEALGHLRAKARAAKVELRQELPRPFPVRADRRRLEQILVNLLDNGIKFNRPGGSVRIAGEVEAAWARLIVEDTGVGIPAEGLDRVFHRFYRGDRARSADVPGTGLGLAIVKHLMGLHGGRVGVTSEVGRGSRFVLEFPR